MKLLSLAISIIISASMAYFAYINLNHSTILMCPFQGQNIELSLFHLVAAVFVFSAVAGFSFANFIFSGKIESLLAYKRKCEKLSVQSDTDDTKLKALEAKIQTLEIALENALKKD